MKVIAALSAVLFIPLAAMFGTNASSAQTELVPTALSILLFVGGNHNDITAAGFGAHAALPLTKCVR